MGLLSNDALVNDGVGGSRDWSVSEGRSGDTLRDEVLEGRGVVFVEVGVSSNGKKAKPGLGRGARGFDNFTFEFREATGKRWGEGGEEDLDERDL